MMFSLTFKTIVTLLQCNINKVHYENYYENNENKKHTFSQLDQEFISKEGILKLN